MTDKKLSGRSASTNSVHVVPEFRKEPDVEKLVRATISIAENTAKERDQANDDDQGVA